MVWRVRGGERVEEDYYVAIVKILRRLHITEKMRMLRRGMEAVTLGGRKKRLSSGFK